MHPLMLRIPDIAVNNNNNNNIYINDVHVRIYFKYGFVSI